MFNLAINATTKAMFRQALWESLTFCFVCDLVDAAFKNATRRQALKAIEEIGGLEVFNNLAPKYASARMEQGFRFIPKIINIDQKWYDKRLRVRRILGKEDYADIVSTCKGIKKSLEMAVAANMFAQEEGE